MRDSNFPKTAKIAIFAVTAATMVIALGAAFGATAQQAEAARSGPQWQYCYSTFEPFYGPYERCYFTNKGECQKAQQSDYYATSDCYRRSY